MRTLSFVALWVAVAAQTYSIISLELKCRALLATTTVMSIQITIGSLKNGQSLQERHETWESIDSAMKRLARVSKSTHDGLVPFVDQLRESFP